MRKDLIKTSLLAALGRASGFLIPFIIAAAFGTGGETDAFFLAYGFILFAVLVVGGLFETLIVPSVTEARNNGRDVGLLVGAIITRSTKEKIHVDICNTCHPFFTGKQKFVDTAGRVEKFQRKFQGSYFGKKSETKA